MSKEKMSDVFWWWFQWALAFIISVLLAAFGLSHAMQAGSSIVWTAGGVLGASIAIALAAVAIAKMRA